MRRQESPAGSSAIDTVGYDDETQVLDVTFNSGQTYTFNGVPQEIFDAFIAAPSPGRFYHASIKGHYA
jgi:hypothetical protein